MRRSGVVLESRGVYLVDADVLLRFLTGEPPGLALRITRLLAGAERGGISLKVHPVVVAETVWVLESFYGRSNQEVAGVLIPLLADYRLNEGRGLEDCGRRFREPRG